MTAKVYDIWHEGMQPLLEDMMKRLFVGRFPRIIPNTP